jgi:hypothetical protein
MEQFDLAEDGIKPLSVLDNRQRNIVAGYVHNEGFVILKRMMIDELRRFNQNLVNTDGTNPKEVLANHNLMKAAAMAYVGLMQRIDREIAVAVSEGSTLGTIGDPERPYYPPEFEGQETF